MSPTPSTFQSSFEAMTSQLFSAGLDLFAPDAATSAELLPPLALLPPARAVGACLVKTATTKSNEAPIVIIIDRGGETTACKRSTISDKLSELSAFLPDVSCFPTTSLTICDQRKLFLSRADKLSTMAAKFAVAFDGGVNDWCGVGAGLSSSTFCELAGTSPDIGDGTDVHCALSLQDIEMDSNSSSPLNSNPCINLGGESSGRTVATTTTTTVFPLSRTHTSGL